MIIVNGRFLTQKMTGVQRYALEVSFRLQKLLGDEMKVVVPSDITDEQLDSRLNIEKIGSHSGHYWEQIELPKWLKRNGSPLLCCFCGVPPIFYPNKILTLHDITFVRYPKTFTFAFRAWYYIAMHQALPRTRQIMTVSEFSKQEIASYYNIDQSRISVVPGSTFDVEGPVEDAELRAKNYILAVSTLKENKNFKVALEAFNLARKRVQDLELVVIGDIDGLSCFTEVSDLVNEFKHCDKVHLVGRVGDEDLVRYYSNARAFLFPSLYEGFGLPVLEAQICGCPVVSTNTCSLPYVLGDSAILCNPLKAEEFADAVVELVTSDSKSDEFRRKGFENVKRFSFERSAEKVVDLIKSLV
ncbi:MAG: glycosyltransferase family 4 protein [Paludibacteraceae bacterium]|nr:glycosyltransferase family 4 protein [Paludibacteraceae bacterium]